MDTSSSTNSYVRAEASIAEAEVLEQMKSRQLSAKGSRIKQGIPQYTETINYANTIKLDEALDAVRGISSSDSERSARDRLLLRKGKQSEERPRQVIEATKVTAHQHHDFELANTWANMLQNADIKASLEAKISAISDQISEIKQNQLSMRSDRSAPLDDVTNKKFETIQDIQNQQLLIQNQLITQLSQVRSQVSIPIVQEHYPPQPRTDVPMPTPPNSYRPIASQPVTFQHPVVIKENIVPGGGTIDRSVDDRKPEAIIPDVDLAWLDEVAPLPVRPSSPINFEQPKPIKIMFESQTSQFDDVTKKLDDVISKRKQFEANYANQNTKRRMTATTETKNQKIQDKVEQAIQEAKKHISKPDSSKVRADFKQNKIQAQTLNSKQKKKSQARPNTRRGFEARMVSDSKLRSVYGKAAWDSSPQKVRNPYLHVNSPEKTKSYRKTTNVKLDYGKSVRSTKQQTTPRLDNKQQMKTLIATQIAPPVRAGPVNRDYNPPPPVLSPSERSSSITTTSTPRSHTSPPNDPDETPIQPKSPKTIDIQGKFEDTQLAREPPIIIKPSYNPVPISLEPPITEARLDGRIDELKNWIESELLHKLIEAKKTKESVVPPAHHPVPPFELRDEAALRLLIEDKFRAAIEARRPKIIEEKSISDSSMSSRSVPYQAPKINLEPFVDHTIGEISTPIPTPIASRVATPPPKVEEQVKIMQPQTTIQNIMEESSVDSSKYYPLPQSLHNSSLGSILGGHMTPVLTDQQKSTSEEISIQNHSTPINTVKSRKLNAKRRLFGVNHRLNETMQSDLSAPTPVRSSTPGKEQVKTPRPKLVSALTQVEPPVEHTVNEKTISSLSASSTYVSSTDASISPGQLLNSFGEFRISKGIKDKIKLREQYKNDFPVSQSLSEGEIPGRSNPVSEDNGIISGMSEGEIRPGKAAPFQAQLERYRRKNTSNISEGEHISSIESSDNKDDNTLSILDEIPSSAHSQK